MPNYYLKISKKILLFFALFLQVTDSKAQKNLAEKADSLFSYKKYEEAAIVYKSLLKAGQVNRKNAFLKLSYIYENSGDYPQALYYLNNYYNLNPGDKVFDKMNQIALENKYSGFDRTDLNFLLMLYQQYFNYLVIFLVIVALYIFWILVRKKYFHQGVSGRNIAIILLYLVFLLGLINAPGNYKSGIIKSKRAYLRTQPTAAAAIEGFITEGNKLNVLGQDDIWLKVLWKRKLVFIKRSDLWLVEN